QGAIVARLLHALVQFAWEAKVAVVPGGVHAADVAHEVLEEKAAALEIPAMGLAGALLLAQPKVKEGLLGEVLAQGQIRGQFKDNLPQHLAGLVLSNEHIR